MVDGAPLTGGKKLADKLWQSDDRKHIYTIKSDVTGKQTLYIKSASGNLVVQDFVTGKLGIDLGAAKPIVIAATGREIIGDRMPMPQMVTNFMNDQLRLLSIPYLSWFVATFTSPGGADTPRLLDPTVIDPFGLVGTVLPANVSNYRFQNIVQELNADGHGTGRAKSVDVTYSQIDDLGNIVHPDGVPADWPDTMHGDELWGSNGNDLMQAGRGSDWVWGRAGNDLIAGGSEGGYIAYVDFLDGGTGNDTVFANDVVDLAVLDSLGNFGGITETGRPGDWLFGEADDDMLFGGKANDVLFGGGGKDLLVGGAGDDVLNGDQARSTVLRANTVSVRGAFGTAYTGYLFEAGIIPDALGDADTLYGGAGNDRLYGLLGDDILLGESGDDVITGDGGNDYILGGDDNDKLDGGADSDYLDGGDGDDTLYGGAGDDILLGGAGRNGLFGDEGNDTYIFERGGIYNVEDYSGVNTYRFGAGFDKNNLTLRLGSLRLDFGGDGEVRIINFDQQNVFDSLGDDSFEFDDGGVLTIHELLARGFDIDGTNLDDILIGTNTTDRIRGFAGNDQLQGGGGDDTLRGGAGDDRYVFRLGDGADQIEDAQGNNTLHIGSDLTAVDIAAERVGNDVRLTVAGSTDSILLSNWFGQAEGVNRIAFCDGSALDRAGIENLMNQPPAANPDAITVYEDGGMVVMLAAALLANDTDPNANDVLSVISVGASEIGASIALANGEVRYDIGNRFQELAAGATLTDSFAYTIADNNGATASSVVNVTIVGVNDGPVAADDEGAAQEDGGAVTLTAATLLANDSDVDAGDTLSILGVSQAASGAAVSLVPSTSSGQGSEVQYDIGSQFQSLGAGQTTTDSFSYTIADSAGAISSANVVMTITGVNDAPVAAIPLTDQTATENSTFRYQLPANSFTDIDMGDTLAYHATLIDGAPLPDWLTFDAVTLTFNSTLPDGAAGLWDINVTATDTAGANASSTFQLDIANLITGTCAADVLIGSEFRDMIYGLGGNDRLSGGAAADLLDGGAGSDVMQGGSGDDIYYVDAAPSDDDDDDHDGHGDDDDDEHDKDDHHNENGNCHHDSKKDHDDDHDESGDQVIEAANGGYDSIYSSVSYTLPANVEALRLIGTAAINATGNAQDNVLTGNAAANVLIGGAGADSMAGGAGNDTYGVDNAGDSVTEAQNEGADTVQSSISYILGANLEHLTLTGASAINATGNELNNTLAGNSAANMLDGGAGIDTVSYVAANGKVTANLALTGPQATGGGGSDTLINIENLTGGNGDDTLIGNAMDNVLDGGAGEDRLKGGAGNDTYVVDDEDDRVTELANEGVDTVKSSASYTLGDHVENLILIGDEKATGTGNELANVLTGNSAANTLKGVSIPRQSRGL